MNGSSSSSLNSNSKLFLCSLNGYHQNRKTDGVSAGQGFYWIGSNVNTMNLLLWYVCEPPKPNPLLHDSLMSNVSLREIETRALLQNQSICCCSRVVQCQQIQGLKSSLFLLANQKQANSLEIFFCDFKTDKPILQFSLFEQNPLLQSSPASCPAIEQKLGTSQSCKKKCLVQFGRRKCSEPHANCAQFGASQR